MIGNFSRRIDVTGKAMRAVHEPILVGRRRTIRSGSSTTR